MREIKLRAWNTSAKQWQTNYSAISCDGNFEAARNFRHAVGKLLIDIGKELLK